MVGRSDGKSRYAPSATTTSCMRSPKVRSPGPMWLCAAVKAICPAVFAAAGTMAATQIDRGRRPRTRAHATAGSQSSALAP